MSSGSGFPLQQTADLAGDPGFQRWQQFQQQRHPQPIASSSAAAISVGGQQFDPAVLLRQALAAKGITPPPPPPPPSVATVAAASSIYSPPPTQQPSYYAIPSAPQQPQLQAPDPEAAAAGYTSIPITQKLVAEAVEDYGNELGKKRGNGGAASRLFWPLHRLHSVTQRWQTWMLLFLIVAFVFVSASLYAGQQDLKLRLDRHERILRTAVLSGNSDATSISGGDTLGGVDIFDSPSATQQQQQQQQQQKRGGQSPPSLASLEEDAQDQELLRGPPRKRSSPEAFSNNGTTATSPLMVSMYSFTIPLHYKPLEGTRIPPLSGPHRSIEGLEIDRVVSYDVCCRLDSGTYSCARGLDVAKSVPSMSANLKRDPETGDQHLLLYLSAGGNTFSGKLCTLQFTQWRT